MPTPKPKEPSHVRNAWTEIKDSWKVIVSVMGVISVLVLAWVEQRVVAIHDAQIAIEALAVPGNVTALQAKAQVLENQIDNHGEAIDRVEDTVVRVEGKLDDLILLLQRQRP